MAFNSLFYQRVQFLDIKETRQTKRTIVAITLMLIVWLSLVIFTETRHEFWRDEVRALSLARQAHSPLDLYHLIEYDGHPALWYLLLYLAKTVVDTPLVLPITAILIGFAAVSVFMLYAPFPLWFRCLFIFSGLPLYEYSVMARNYGISMLLMFIFATLYRQRTKHPYSLAITLALLANTNAHSAILTGLLTLVWVWDEFRERTPLFSRERFVSFYLPVLIVVLGLGLCLVFVYPRENSIIVMTRSNINLEALAPSILKSLLKPQILFHDLVPLFIPQWALFVLISLSILGLIGRPVLFLIALVGQVSFGIFFLMVYGGNYRHQGLFFVFILVLYWLFLEHVNPQSLQKVPHFLYKAGFYSGMGLLVVASLFLSFSKTSEDIYKEKSSSRELGAFLNQTAQYQDAILVPEPDNYLEALPYYADNQIYLPREHRFGNTVTWTTSLEIKLSLKDLLATARELKIKYNRTILIVLGPFNLKPNVDGKQSFSYGKEFFWTTADLQDFLDSTTLLKRFDNALGSENYSVYLLK